MTRCSDRCPVSQEVVSCVPLPWQLASPNPSGRQVRFSKSHSTRLSLDRLGALGEYIAKCISAFQTLNIRRLFSNLAAPQVL